MSYAGLPFLYIMWHYTRGIQEYLNVWTNVVWFLYNFFSIPLLARTLIAPWRRLDEHKRVGLNLEALFEKILINGVVRVIGIFLRTFVILSGFMAILLALILGFVFFVVWVLMPVAVPALVIGGLWLIIL